MDQHSQTPDVATGFSFEINNPARKKVVVRNQDSARPSVHRHESEIAIRTAIFSTAASFVPHEIQYLCRSSFTPNASVLLYLLGDMDHTMVSTPNWTDSHLGWTPIHSMIYISMLFYIQTLRAMNAAKAFPAASEFRTLLGNLLSIYPLDDLWIPGPLVEYFSNLACFSPTMNVTFGKVCPILPLKPEWSLESSFALPHPYHYYLPNISAMISRLHTICAVATKADMSESLFASDINGPRYCGKIFGHWLRNEPEDRRLIQSPGLGNALPGDLNLWINAAMNLEDSNFPAGLNSSTDKVSDTWGNFLQLHDFPDWFGPLSSMMADYCHYWKGSAPLSDCSPSGSSAGAVKCNNIEADSTMFSNLVWTSRNGQVHGNPSQNGHYVLACSQTLGLH